ncbi:MAG: hypothetical protein KME06_09080 [Kastovskya adunca ATA6-11-RM4]|jgi:hypothetical protein|nr:hypothetical protein [Kastovskya adunca ATA6-11-RM4]
MVYKALAVLGIFAAIAGSTNSVHAQSTVRSSSTGEYTLSGDSLLDIESRTLNKDYPIFFSDDATVFLSNGTNNGAPLVPQAATPTTVIELDDSPAEIVIRDPLFSPLAAPTFFPPNESPTGIERVQFQLNRQ